jgi:hypothetical protein
MTYERTRRHSVDFQNKLDEIIIREALKRRTTKQISITADCTHHQVTYCLRKAGINRNEFRDGSGAWFKAANRVLNDPVINERLDKAANVLLKNTGKLK